MPNVEFGEVEALSALIEAALHEWRTMPRWRRLELEKGSCVAYIYEKLAPAGVTLEQIRQVVDQ